jgi:hypothetical protein
MFEGGFVANMDFQGKVNECFLAQQLFLYFMVKMCQPIFFRKKGWYKNKTDHLSLAPKLDESDNRLAKSPLRFFGILPFG